MRIKVHEGTAANGEPSLCVTCRHATIVKGARLRDEITQCSQLADGISHITFAVTSCSAYSDRRRPSIHAMEEIAWVLRSDPKKNDIGFVRASTLRLRDRFVLPEE